MTAQGDEKDVWTTLGRERIAMLTTFDGEDLVSRPMASMARPDEGMIYFVTHLPSGLVGEIGGQAPVNLGYANTSKNTYLSVSGTARTTQNREKLRELWSAESEAWLPQGPDAPDVALIEVTPGEAKLWDATSSTLIHAAKVLKAVVTQSPPDGGRVTEVTL